MIYSSSIVSKGRGSGIAIGTGLNTEIGSIAKSLQGDSGLIRKVDKSNGRQPQREYFHAGLGSIYDIVGNILGVTTGTPLQKDYHGWQFYCFGWQ